MDWNRVEGNWKEVKGKAKQKWAKLTDDDLAATIFAFGDDPFECPVVERVILGHDRQPPFAVPVGRPVWNRPRLQDAVGFQAKVIMQLRRAMLLDDKDIAELRRFLFRTRLRCFFEAAFLLVFG